MKEQPIPISTTIIQKLFGSLSWKSYARMIGSVSVRGIFSAITPSPVSGQKEYCPNQTPEFLLVQDNLL